MEKHISEEVVHLGTDGARLGRCNTDLARFSGRKIKTSLLACSISYYVREPTKKAPRCLTTKQNAVLEVNLQHPVCVETFSESRALDSVP
ncbi:hypothetical protein HID58_039401 [Brassica napus]|uniref:GTP-eEF1A C-terminal domain-containing protein n=1 Tax=Brassica napus TaxID=3708 RepID=A0ABQ8BS32_BRANA|nr:hypothetical protein HID58_039401 [Brassica napus]